MDNFKILSFEELFDFPVIQPGITAEFIHNNKGDLPVYGSRKDGKPIGFMDESVVIKCFENCLSWNRNGSVGYVFYRNHKFTTTDDHRPLIIKENLKDNLDIEFLKFMIQNTILGNGFAWNNKAGVDKLKLLYLSIPIDSSGNFDLNKQAEIAKRYRKIQDLQEKSIEYLDILNNSQLKLEDESVVKYKDVELTKLFNFFKGNAKYTHKYFINHSGDYPVYSSQTENEGEIAKINTFDWNTGSDKWLTWTTDGIYAGTVFLRNGKFSMTTHCGLMKPKDIFPESIYMDYLEYILNRTLSNFALGDQNKRVTKSMLENGISIKIPVNKNGNFDFDKQVDIAKKYKELENKKKQIKFFLEQIKNTQVNIDFFN